MGEAVNLSEWPVFLLFCGGVCQVSCAWSQDDAGLVEKKLVTCAGNDGPVGGDMPGYRTTIW